MQQFALSCLRVEGALHIGVVGTGRCAHRLFGSVRDRDLAQKSLAHKIQHRNVFCTVAMVRLRRTARGLPVDIAFVVCAILWLDIFDLQPSLAYSIQSRARFLQSAIHRHQVALVVTASTWVTTGAADASAAKNLPDPVTTSTTVASRSTEALQPILQLRRDLQHLAQEVQASPRPSDDTLSILVESLPRTETAFKAVFDRYSDPVSYKQKFVDQNAFLVCMSCMHVKISPSCTNQPQKEGELTTVPVALFRLHQRI